MTHWRKYLKQNVYNELEKMLRLNTYEPNTESTRQKIKKYALEIIQKYVGHGKECQDLFDYYVDVFPMEEQNEPCELKLVFAWKEFEGSNFTFAEFKIGRDGANWKDIT